MARIKSDHCPVLICMNSGQIPRNDRKPFRFEAMWLNHSDFEDFTKSHWPTDDTPISSKVASFTKSIKQWNIDVFGNIFRRKKRLIARIAGIQKVLCRQNVPFLVNLEKQLTQEYNEILSNEEIFWRQKSRNIWLKEGDKNTRFFHLSTIVRRQRNRIEGSMMLMATGELINWNFIILM